MKYTYLLLCVLGTVLPMSQFVPWLLQNGIDPVAFVSELFSTRIGGFFGLDVIVSAVVLLVFINAEGKSLQIESLWLPVLATLLVGVSLGLPLFLLMRESGLPARA